MSKQFFLLTEEKCSHEVEILLHILNNKRQKSIYPKIDILIVAIYARNINDLRRNRIEFIVKFGS